MTDKMIEAFDGTRKASAIASGALDEVTKIIKPGIKTDEIDKLCFEFINDNEAYSAPLFYRGFPKSCCTSPNHTVCHGIPKDKILKEGDMVETPPYEKHALKIIKRNEFIVFTVGKRGGKDYESDTYRFLPSLINSNQSNENYQIKK